MTLIVFVIVYGITKYVLRFGDVEAIGASLIMSIAVLELLIEFSLTDLRETVRKGLKKIKKLCDELSIDISKCVSEEQ